MQNDSARVVFIIRSETQTDGNHTRENEPKYENLFAEKAAMNNDKPTKVK